MPLNRTTLLRAAALFAAVLTLLALAAACGGGEDSKPSPSGTQAGNGAGTATAPAATPGAATDNCVPGNGPPSQGSGPDGLPGRITFVTFKGKTVVKVKETYAALGGSTAPPLPPQ